MMLRHLTAKKKIYFQEKGGQIWHLPAIFLTSKDKGIKTHIISFIDDISLKAKKG